MLDFDAAGNLVGFDIDHASETVNLSRSKAESLPIEAFSIARATSQPEAGSGWGGGWRVKAVGPHSPTTATPPQASSCEGFCLTNDHSTGAPGRAATAA